MRIPLLATFLPQVLITLIVGVVSIVVFSEMHDSAITETMESSLRGSLLYVESQVAEPFERARRNAIDLRESAKNRNAVVFRGTDADRLSAETNVTSLLQLRDHLQDMRAKIDNSNDSYAFVFQSYRLSRRAGTSNSSTDPRDFHWGRTGATPSYCFHARNFRQEYIFAEFYKYPNFTTTDLHTAPEERGVSEEAQAGLMYATAANASEGWYSRLYTFVPHLHVGGHAHDDEHEGHDDDHKDDHDDNHKDEHDDEHHDEHEEQDNTHGGVRLVMSVSVPMSFDPQTGYATSVMTIEVDCLWLGAFLRGIDIAGTETSIIYPSTGQVMASSFASVPTYHVQNASEPQNVQLWNAMDSPEPRLTMAMKHIAAAGHSLAALPLHTQVINSVDDGEIYSVRGIRLARLNLAVVGVTRRSHFFSNGDAARRDAVIVCAVLLVVAIVVAILTAVLLSRPLRDLGERMAITARLGEDSSELHKSTVAEIGDMQSAYLGMKSELNRVKPFLPQSLAARKDSDGEGEAVNVLAIDTPNDTTTNDDAASLDQSRDFIIGADMLREERNVIAPRDCVIAIISVAYGVDLDEANSIAVLDKIFRTVFGAVDAYRGVIETVTPHQIVVTFGARYTLSNPAGEALKMALRIANGTRSADVYSVTTLLDAQSVFVGSCGTEHFRQNVAFSNDIEALKSLATVTHQLHNQPTIATGRITPSFINDRVWLLPTDLVEWKLGDKVSLYAVTHRHAFNDPDDDALAAKSLRHAFAAVARGSLAEAEVDVKAANDTVFAPHHLAPDALKAMSQRVCQSLHVLIAECQRCKTPCRRFTNWGFLETGFIPKLPGAAACKMPARAQKQIESLADIGKGAASAFGSPVAGLESSGIQETSSLFPMAFTGDGDQFESPAGKDLASDPVAIDGVKHIRHWQLSAKPIAGGSFGKVHRALHENGSLAAVKVLPLRSRAITVESLQKELSITAQQRHENLVGYVDAHISDEELLVVMELMAGGSLGDLLRDFGCLSHRMVRRFTLGILRGLSHLHRSGIVHCDVKPQNCLLGVDGVCKLADFGSALHPRMGATLPEDSFSVVGTPGYMAPEVARGEEATAASDVWSLGMMVHELLTGELPLNEAQRAAMRTGPSNVVRMVGRFRDSCTDPTLLEAPPRPALQNVQASRDEIEMVREFISRCLMVDPNKRPTVEALLVMEFLL